MGNMYDEVSRAVDKMYERARVCRYGRPHILYRIEVRQVGPAIRQSRDFRKRATLTASMMAASSPMAVI